jgi:hypothetical protein
MLGAATVRIGRPYMTDRRFPYGAFLEFGERFLEFAERFLEFGERRC